MATIEELKDIVNLTTTFINNITILDNTVRCEKCCAIMQKTAKVIGYSDLEFADLFGVSRPTATRWRLGKSCPHPAVTHHFFNSLIDLANKLIEKKLKEENHAN